MKPRELEELGRGSFGRVYRGYDDERGEEVAVKELLDPSTDLDRFVREARLLSEHIDNVYVVNILRWEFSDARPYIVLEYCEGRSLRPWVGHAAWDQAAMMLLHAANGLLGIHTAGGFHRDLKPENLLLGRAPGVEGYVVKVADFGLARSPKTAKPPMTRSPGGTDGYIAPELANPAVQFAPVCDVYSLGIVGVELITGLRSNSGLASVQMPDAFRSLLLRMTSPVRAFRPSTADIVIELGRILEQGAAPPPPPPPRPAPPRPGGNGIGWLFVLGALGAAAALAGGNKKEWDDNVERYRGPDGRFRRG